MICELTLPGVLDIDFEPFIDESEGRWKCQVKLSIDLPAQSLFRFLAPPVMSTILRGEISHRLSNGLSCCSTDPSFNIRNI
jgi:hypothetical protein